MRSAEEALRQLVAPVCAERGLSCYDVELRARTVQVTVEGEHGLELETLAEIARVLSGVLDEHEEITPGGRYELEVTSPGLERRLRRPEHFVAAVGERVALRRQSGVDGPRRVEGTLRGATATALLVETDSGEVSVSPDELERAHTVFDWRAALAEHKSEARAAARTNASGSKTTVGAGEEHAR